MTVRRFLFRLGLTIAMLTVCLRAANARELHVGPGEAYAAPSAAAAVAQEGDTVDIAPGIYYDCAVWRANGLTISGTGPGVQITDRACAGKAAFVIDGNNVHIERLNFARVRVMDGNGAGIRAEGHDLTVQDSGFVNNQDGILAGGPGGELRIIDCIFDGNGVSWDDRPTHAVSVGSLDLLRVEHTTFENARGGNHIQSAARRTEIINSTLIDEGGRMSGAMVQIAGPTLILDRNTLDLRPGAAERPGAVLVFEATNTIVVTNNTLVEPKGDVPLLRNWSGNPATVTANVVPPDAVAVTSSGTLYHEMRTQKAAFLEQLHSLAGLIRHTVATIARRYNLIP
jgi:hypothetical protein